MTSTNDGKDVKSNRITGQKAKTYYIELYKNLDARLSVEQHIEARTPHLCEAWRRVHSLCRHSTASTHEHLVNWLQRHTAQTILQSEWPNDREKHTALLEAVDTFIAECATSVAARNGPAAEWEVQLLRLATWLKTVIPDPWGNAVLKAVLGLPDAAHESPSAAGPTDDQILEWLKEERGVFFLTRIRQLGMSKGNDIAKVALKLASCVMDRLRACTELVPDMEPLPRQYLESRNSLKKKKNFADILITEAGFSVDLLDLLTDIELVLLYKDRSKCIALAKQTQLMYGYPLVERLHSRYHCSPRVEKRLWKNAIEVATLIAQVMIARCMVVPTCEANVRYTLYGCARSLVKLVPSERLPACAAALAAPAATARHLHTLAVAVHIQVQGNNEQKPFVCELYIRAITAGMNELERLKLNKDKEMEARATERLLASWFMQLGTLLEARARLTYECALTAFSLHPSRAMYERIRAAPQLQPHQANATATPTLQKDGENDEMKTKSEFGSWANDSRSQTNFVKTSETLNLKKIQQLSNVLSTAVLNEGEALGLSPELCQDLIVLLSGPRLKTLSWDMEKDILLENCRSYMERTHGGTKALTTELKYLNLAPDSFMHLPEEEDQDEGDIYYGIEKGYEHLVETQDPEEIWEDGPYDFEKTESPYATDNESPIPVPRRKKKVRSLSDSLDEEELDPLSTHPIESKPRSRSNESRKERSKERSKDRKKKDKQQKDRSVSGDKNKDREKTNVLNDTDLLTLDNNEKKHKPKKERKKKEEKKEEKKVHKSALSRLVGKKVIMMNNPINTHDKVTRTEVQPEIINQMVITGKGYTKPLISPKYTEEKESDVIVDGLFSMDDLKCTDEIAAITHAVKVEPINSSSNEELWRNMIKVTHNPKAPNPSHMQNYVWSNEQTVMSTPTPTLMKSTNDDSSILSSTPNLPQQEVKLGIKRLIEFRKQKSSTDLSIDTRTGIKLDNASTLNRTAPNKFDVTNRMTDVSRIQIGSPKSISVPNIPKVYINKQQSEKLNILKSEIDNYIVAHGSKSQFEMYPNRNETVKTDMKPNNLVTAKIVKPSNVVNTQRNIVEQKVFNTLHQGEPVKVSGSVTSKLAQQSNTNVKQNIPRQTVINTETSNLQDFFKDLHRSINAGVSKEDSRLSVQASFSNLPSSSTNVSNCAKQIKPPKKVENAPNTFARLNYLHKNKQGENVCKQNNNPQIMANKDKLQYLNDILLPRCSNTVIRKMERVPQKKVTKPFTEYPAKTEKTNYNLTQPAVSATVKTTKPNDDQLRLLLRQQNLNVSKSAIKSDGVVNDRTSAMKNNGVNVPTSYNLGTVYQRVDDTIRNQLQDYQAKIPSNRVTENVIPYRAASANIIKAVEPSAKVNSRHKNVTGQSKTNFKAENKNTGQQNWESVMNDLLSHKTPNRNINAHESILQKELPGNNSQVHKHNASKHRECDVNPNITNIKMKEENILNNKMVTKQNLHGIQQKQQSLSIENNASLLTNASSVRNNPLVTLNNTTPATNKPIYLQSVDQNAIKKPNQTILSKIGSKVPDLQFPTGAMKKELNCGVPCEDPHIPNIPYSDYDILEELMDDDLRQEIGELSSDDEKPFSSLNTTTKASKVKSDIIKPIHMEASRNRVSSGTLNATQAEFRSKNQGAHVYQSEIKVADPITIPKPTSFENFVLKPLHNTMHVVDINKNSTIIQNTKPANVFHHVIKPTITSTNLHLSQTDQTDNSNISKQCQFATSRKSNNYVPNNNKGTEVTCNQNMNNLQSTSTTNGSSGNIYTAVMQRPVIQNVVLIRPEHVYDPCAAGPVCQSPETNSNICNVTAKTFITVDASPKIYGTSYATSVAKPLIIGNSVNVPISHNITPSMVRSVDNISYNNPVKTAKNMESAKCNNNVNDVDPSKVQGTIRNSPSSLFTGPRVVKIVNERPKAGNLNVNVCSLHENSVKREMSKIQEKYSAIASNCADDVSSMKAQDIVMDSHSNFSSVQSASTVNVINYPSKNNNFNGKVCFPNMNSSTCDVNYCFKKNNTNVDVSSTDTKFERTILSEVQDKFTAKSSCYFKDYDHNVLGDIITNTPLDSLTKELSSKDTVHQSSLIKNENLLRKSNDQSLSEGRSLSNVKEKNCIIGPTFSNGQNTLHHNVTAYNGIDHVNINLCTVNNNVQNPVLSRVQEESPVNVPEKLNSSYPVTSEGEVKKDSVKMREERFKRKKEAILNRKIHIFSSLDPIPLTYSPLSIVDDISKRSKIIIDKAKILITSDGKLEKLDLKSCLKIDAVSNDVKVVENSIGVKINEEQNESALQPLMMDGSTINDNSNITDRNDTTLDSCKKLDGVLSTLKDCNHDNITYSNKRKQKILKKRNKLRKVVIKRLAKEKERKKHEHKTPTVDKQQNTPSLINASLDLDIEKQLLSTIIPKNNTTINGIASGVEKEDDDNKSITSTLQIGDNSSDCINQTTKASVVTSTESENKEVGRKNTHLSLNKIRVINMATTKMKIISTCNQIKEDKLGNNFSCAPKSSEEVIIMDDDTPKHALRNGTKFETDPIKILKGDEPHIRCEDTLKMSKQSVRRDPLQVIKDTDINAITCNTNKETSKIPKKPRKTFAFIENQNNDSFKDQIIIEEFPRKQNDDPLKRCIIIKLPNGNNFKATVSGRLQGDIDTIFKDPAIRSILINNLPANERCVLNIQQVGSANSDNIKVIYPKQKHMGTINLVSDDEEETSKVFMTEFGKYRVKILEDRIFMKHQNKFSQKCFVKLQRSKNQQNKLSSISDGYNDMKHEPTANKCATEAKPIKATPQLADDNISPVIEIDDSSNDSITVNNKSPSESVQQFTVPVNNPNDFEGLKEKLLQDLCVNVDDKKQNKNTLFDENSTSKTLANITKKLETNLSKEMVILENNDSIQNMQTDHVDTLKTLDDCRQFMNSLHNNIKSGNNDQYISGIHIHSIDTQLTSSLACKEFVDNICKDILTEDEHVHEQNCQTKHKNIQTIESSKDLKNNLVQDIMTKTEEDTQNTQINHVDDQNTKDISKEYVHNLSTLKVPENRNLTKQYRTPKTERKSLNSSGNGSYKNKILSPRKCQVKIEKCDHLAKKYQLIKLAKQCFVPLVRCDGPLQIMTLKKDDEKVPDIEDKVDGIMVNDNVYEQYETSNCSLKRSGSFSILNEFNLTDLSIKTSKSNQFGFSKTISLEKVYNYNVDIDICHSDWHMTKLECRQFMRQVKHDYSLSDDNSTDCDSDHEFNTIHVSSDDKVNLEPPNEYFILNQVPSLLNLTLKCFTNITTSNSHTSNSSLLHLKRKISTSENINNKKILKCDEHKYENNSTITTNEAINKEILEKTVKIHKINAPIDDGYILFNEEKTVHSTMERNNLNLELNKKEEKVQNDSGIRINSLDSTSQNIELIDDISSSVYLNCQNNSPTKEDNICQSIATPNSHTTDSINLRYLSNEEINSNEDKEEVLCNISNKPVSDNLDITCNDIKQRENACCDVKDLEENNLQSSKNISIAHTSPRHEEISRKLSFLKEESIPVRSGRDVLKLDINKVPSNDISDSQQLNYTLSSDEGATESQSVILNNEKNNLPSSNKEEFDENSMQNTEETPVQESDSALNSNETSTKVLNDKKNKIQKLNEDCENVTKISVHNSILSEQNTNDMSMELESQKQTESDLILHNKMLNCEKYTVLPNGKPPVLNQHNINLDLTELQNDKCSKYSEKCHEDLSNYDDAFQKRTDSVTTKNNISNNVTIAGEIFMQCRNLNTICPSHDYINMTSTESIDEFKQTGIAENIGETIIEQKKHVSHDKEKLQTMNDCFDEKSKYASSVEKDHTENKNDDTLCKNITLVYEGNSKLVLKGSMIENPIVGTCYVFPIIHSDMLSPVIIGNDNAKKNTDQNPCQEQTIVQKTTTDLIEDADLVVTKPKVTYSKTTINVSCVTQDSSFSDKSFKRCLKRKFESLDNKTIEKKYRKGKNIDYPKITVAAMCDNAYSKEFKKLSNYYSSLKFSYSNDYHFIQVEDVHSMLIDWPIKESNNSTLAVDTDSNLIFDKVLTTFVPDPMLQSLAEEISSAYNEREISSDEIKETNFSMGFGERSGRVNQNLKDRGGSTKFSAATLSDVKQFQPCIVSEDANKSSAEALASRQGQLQKLDVFYSNIKLREKVRSFFRKNTAELLYSCIKDYEKLNKMKSISNDFCSNVSDSFFDLSTTDFFEPPLIENIVQVVQLGQLPVSAAAQNPVTCDPRVTQVTDASLSQCSMENGSHDDLQPIKTEYTELTTADITLPVMPDYEHQHHHQSVLIASPVPNSPIGNDDITIETEVKIEVLDEVPENIDEQNCYESKDTTYQNNDEFSFESSDKVPIKTEPEVQMVIEPLDNDDCQMTESYQPQQQNGLVEKPDQLAHAMNAAGIATSPDPTEDTAMDLTNIRNDCSDTDEANYSRSTVTNMTLQQAIAQILPSPINQNIEPDNNSQVSVASQILHIVHGKNSTLNHLTATDNPQQPVANSQNSTPVLHLVQSKNGTISSTNDSTVHNTHPYNGLSLVDSGMSQGGNQLLHIVNTGNQKTNSSTQLLKRVNLLTNLTNVQGSNEQKMVQFVCKPADAKSIQLNTHQRSMVLRLQPVESPQPAPSKMDCPDSSSTTSESPTKESLTSVSPEIKSRSVYEENYAKFIQTCNKALSEEKSGSLPKFNQAFGKPVFQEDNQKPNEINGNEPLMTTVDANMGNNDCQSTEHALHVENIRQIASPPLLLRKPSTQTSQSQQNLVHQIKQAITPMNIQTMHGGVIYTRQIPVNIGGGQTINLITVPSTECIDESVQKQKHDIKFGSRGEMEQPIIKIVPQSPSVSNGEVLEENNNSGGVANENTQNSQPPPMLTQMRIKLPMLSKNTQMVSGTRVVRPSFFQIQRNVIGGANQPVYQQLVLTAAPTLGHQAIRLPQAQTSREMKVGNEGQSSSECHMSSSTLEQLREFDMVLEQVKERSTGQPNGSPTHEYVKTHTSGSDTTNNASSSTLSETTQQVLYSIGNQVNVAYINRKSTVVSTQASTSFARSSDTSGTVESPTSSSHVPTTLVRQTVTSEAAKEPHPPQNHHKPTKVSSKSKSRPKSHHPQFKSNFVPPKPSNQKSIEDEQTTQRILYILAEYKEQVENSPDKDKPAPRRRTNLQATASTGPTKRKKSSSGSRRSGRDSSPIDDNCRTMGSEDSCGTSQGDCSETCPEVHSPQDSPRKAAKKVTSDQDPPITQPRPQMHRNVLVTDGPTIAVTRAAPGKPATAVLMPANYILPVSMVKNGQQIAIVTNRGPKILTVSGGEGGTTNALLLQRLIGPAGLKPMLARPGVRHVRLPAAALHNLQAFNINAPAPAQQPENAPSPVPATSPPELIETKTPCSQWTAQGTDEVTKKPEQEPSPEPEKPEPVQVPVPVPVPVPVLEPEPVPVPEPEPEPEPWSVPQDYSYEETVRTEMDRTVLDAIPDRYSPDMEAQRIFDKMFEVESKKDYIVDSQDDSPRCPYDIDASDCDDKAYHQVVHRRDGVANRHRFVSAATLRQKFALMEDELRLQKSLSEECEDLGVDSPSTSDLFPEAELLFSSSPAHEAQHSHTPQPVVLNQSGNILQADVDDQMATDQLISSEESRSMDSRRTEEIDLGLDDVGIVTVSEDGMRATISLDHEEFVRSHPNTTFHSEPTQDGEVHTVSLEDLKSRHITSTIFQAGRAPATVLVSRPQTTVISQATPDGAGVDHVGCSHAEALLGLSSVLVKDDGKFDSLIASKDQDQPNTARVIRRVRFDDRLDRETRYHLDDPTGPMAGNDAHTTTDDSTTTLESTGDEDDRSSPERSSELFWEMHAKRIDRRPLDFSSDSDKCCKSPYDENNSTDSSNGVHVRMDSVIKDARGIDRSDDGLPLLRTYPPKRTYHTHDRHADRVHGHSRKAESSEGRRRASNRGVVKRGCHCCNGSPAPPKPKKPRQRKPALDFN